MGLMMVFVLSYWNLPKEYGGAKHFFYGPKKREELQTIKGRSLSVDLSKSTECE